LRFGSIRSQGDQARQFRKSSMSAKTFSGGALMLVARSMRKVSGFVTARTRTAATATSRTTAMMARTFIDLSDYGSRGGVDPS
jgi:hypothetical protein